MLLGLRPQLLDAALRTTQEAVDVKAVGVGCYLRSDPGRQSHQGRRKRLPEPEYPLETRKSDLYALPCAVLVGPLGHHRDPAFGQGMTQRFASVGEVPEEPAGDIVSQVFASASSSSVRRTSATLAGVSS